MAVFNLNCKLCLFRVKYADTLTQTKLLLPSSLTRVEDTEINEFHCMYHMGVDRTLFWVYEVYSEITRRLFKKWLKIVIGINQLIFPLAYMVDLFNSISILSVSGHYWAEPYLSMVATYPVPQSIWKEIQQTVAIITGMHNEVFLSGISLKEIPKQMEGQAILQSVL